MIYVIGDIHGCYEKYQNMLKKLKPGNADSVFILGDVIDYGTDGIKILFDLMYRPNFYPVLGEHEYMAKKILPLANNINSIDELKSALNDDDNQTLECWLKSGGEPTLSDFLALDDEERESIIDYLDEFAPFEEVTAGGRDFVLVHAGIKDFDEEKNLEDYNEEDFITQAADYSKIYFTDKYLVTGHTPTVAFNPNGCKIYSKKRHLALDCAACYGEKLAAVCLDTLKAYYC